MNTIFDIKRIGLILRTDWIEHKKLFGITAGLLLVSSMLLLWNTGQRGQFTLFWLGMLITIISYLSFMGKKVNHAKGLWLTLPASTLEKFVSLIIVGLTYILSFVLIYWIASGVSLLANGTPVVESRSLVISWKASGFILFNVAYFFLCFVIFRKYALGIGMAIQVLIFFIISYIMNLLVKSGILFSINIPDKIGNILGELVGYYNPIFYILAIVLFYISYVRLKKKQIR